MNANSYYMYQILSQANRKGHNVISFVAHTKYDRRVAARYMRKRGWKLVKGSRGEKRLTFNKI